MALIFFNCSLAPLPCTNKKLNSYENVKNIFYNVSKIKKVPNPIGQGLLHQLNELKYLF